jgi:hypothetical protein
MSDKTRIGRLALRVEGENWNAYYALNETMEGAVPLGSIKLGAVTRNPAHKKAFMDLMRGVVSDIQAWDSLAPAGRNRLSTA